MMLIDANEMIFKYGDWYVEEGSEEGFIGTVEQLVEMLQDAQPTAQPEQRWIPVTERLPEYEKEVLTCDNRGGMSVGKLCFSGFGHADRWYVDYSYDSVDYVVAWMPLPEPYTEETT